MTLSWVRTTLGNSCEMYQPVTISSKQLIADGKYLVYGANGVIGRYNQFNHENSELLITCRGATCGRINVTVSQSWINGNAMVVRPKSNQIDIRFLEYALRGGVDLSVAITGSAQPQITRTSLQTIEIKYPSSLEEQRRIVAILDEAFDAIATAKANTERNLQNAKELFSGYLERAFSPSKDWEYSSLVNICEVKDGTHNSPKYVSIGIPFVTQKNITPFGLCLSNTRFISKKDHDDFYRRSNVNMGDILISMIGANRGMSCIVDTELVFSIKNVGLIKHAEGLSQEFLLRYLQSPVAENYIKISSKGGAQEFVGLGALRKFPVPIPSLETQLEVVGGLDDLSINCKQLESIYQQKLAALDELKKSLLHQAFTGKL